MHVLSRRSFLRASAGALLATPLAARAATDSPWELHTFTKPFQKTTFERTGEILAEVGWKGIELPLRKGGQIEPERVEEDLPKLVEILAKRGLTVGHITTDIVNTSTPHAEKVLRTAKKLGITRYRLGFQKYDNKRPIPEQLAAIKQPLKDLAALNAEIGISGGIQNHSGPTYIGAAIWDIYELVRDLDPKALGICFDIGHATLEGGSAWLLNARLMEPWMVCVYVKDFAWRKGAKGFESKWGPLGEGMVRREFFEWLRKSSYRGPISQHVEYITGDGPEQMAQYKKDFEVLKAWTDKA